MPRKLIIAATLCALSTGAAGTAAAQALASASVAGLRYELIDLAPGDGITPALTFLVSSWSGSAIGYESSVFSAPQSDAARVSGVGTASVENADGAAFAGLSDTGVETLARFRDTAFESEASFTRGFTLTPHTGVTFTAMSTTNVAYRGQAPAEGQEPTTRTGAGLSGVLITGAGIRTNFGAGENAVAGLHSFPISASAYTQDEAVGGQIALTAFSIARALPPVPEPSHWAMLLAGLALLGSAVRRASGASLK